MSTDTLPPGGLPASGPAQRGMVTDMSDSETAVAGGVPPVELDIWISALGRMSAAHPDMGRILHVVDRLQDRAYRSHVLLRGEAGTGKEGLARLLHRLMHPDGGPSERVHLSGRSPAQIHHDLFGGPPAGTDGGPARLGGAFGRARGGSLVIDEILALPPDAQLRLHEALSRQRWGERDSWRAAVVVIAMSDGDVVGAVANGLLRHDLAYKLGRIILTVPPLRERPEDLSRAALWTANRILRGRAIDRSAELWDGDAGVEPLDAAGPGLPPYRVTPEALAALGRYPGDPRRAWPGNFRELEAVIERAILLYSDGETLRESDVERALADTLLPVGSF